MANKYWLADVPTAWDTGAAWTGGVKPGAGDDAIFRSDHVGNVTAPAGVETVGNVRVMPGYTGLMGTSGAKLTVNCTELTYEGDGVSAWWTSTLDRCVVQTARTDPNSFNLIATFTGDERMIVLAGRAHLSGAYGFLVCGDARGRGSPDVVLESTPSLNYLVVDAGRVRGTAVSIGSDAVISGGDVELTDMAGNIGRLNMSGGRLSLLGTTDFQLGRSYIHGGMLDATLLRALLTIGTSIIVGRRGQAHLDSGRPLAISAGAFGEVLPGGVLRQTGTVLPVNYL